jgi:DNA-cytosine methyltransferase
VARILDLYCGMGGLSLGFALALGGAEILGLDIDKDAVATYNFNLGGLGCRAEKRDALAWEPSGGFDIVIGGPPCQPFSHANVTNIGEAHQLYPTFPRFFDIVLALKPRAFLMENVKGLLRKRFEPILRGQLERVAGEYDIRRAVLNAVSYGVPQRRERLFVVGIRKDAAGVFRFPEPTHGERPVARLDGTSVHKWVTLREAIGDLAPLPPEEMTRLLVAPEAAERIRKEREDENKYWAKMEFPDDPNKPARTIAAHTVEGAKKSTIIVPTSAIAFQDTAGNVVEIPWTRFQEKHKPLDPDEPSSTLVGNLAKSSRYALVPVRQTFPYLTADGRVVEKEWTRFQEIHEPFDPDEPSRTLIAHIPRAPRCALIPVAAGDEVHEGGFSSLYLSRNRRPEWDEPSFTVLASARHEPLHPASEPMVKAGRNEWRFAGGGVVYRRLSVRECLRVQSFPDWWRFPDGVSTTKKYRLVGEAVPPVLAYRLALALGRALGLPVREPPREEEWALPYFRRAFADYFGG